MTLYIYIYILFGLEKLNSADWAQNLKAKTNLCINSNGLSRVGVFHLDQNNIFGSKLFGLR